MPSLRGVVIGDSQVKFMCRSRLPLKASVKTCTFSYAGFDALRMAEAVSSMRFQRVDFAILYVGGNDLANVNAEPQEICDNIGELVLQLQHDVAPIVYVFKVLPRCFNPEDADAERKTRKARLLNCKLTATLKCWPCVRILNAEVSLRRHENAVPSWSARSFFKNYLASLVAHCLQ
ncbi:uncharacterized protein LOC119391794 [Rhipicephalus sanguineus]|uniref:uncharacterized protein LOC119391794 n=1 Tax=Rhipicephalus sanguineus TaxID=34632 RepID=UPI0020C53FF9|nr:uncharacterized protein LOC119391794 [Rhipicephalus sanguineus]